MNIEKSRLQIKIFKKAAKLPKIITRFTSLENVIDFVMNSQLHFSPLSSFDDCTEGKNLKQAALISNEKESKDQKVPSFVRRDILYASCWHIGNENLYMWDIYGKNKNCLAIQLKTDSLLEHVFIPGDFWFSSKKNIDKEVDNNEFKISSFHCGKVDYIKLNGNNTNLYIGRFKDKAFSHEKEFRFLLRQNYKGSPPVGLKDLKCKFINNAEKKINVRLLVSPYADDSYFEFIATAFKQYKNVVVRHSKFKELFK